MNSSSELAQFFENHPQYGVFIQARNGSSRLPGKMSMDFHQGQTIPEILIRRLLNRGIPGKQIVLATTNLQEDYSFVHMAKDLGIQVYQGPVYDVIARFLQAANRFEKEVLVRICADNPFLEPNYLLPLLKTLKPGEVEYVSYAFPDGTPAMRSHLGLLAEAVSCKLLAFIRSRSRQISHREHVTSFVYEHPKLIPSTFLPVPAPWTNRTDLRLTVDTAADFEAMRNLYSHWAEGPIALETQLELHPECTAHMHLQMQTNVK